MEHAMQTKSQVQLPKMLAMLDSYFHNLYQTIIQIIYICIPTVNRLCPVPNIITQNFASFTLFAANNADPINTNIPPNRLRIARALSIGVKALTKESLAEDLMLSLVIYFAADFV
jgi:hypothetical protein